MLRGAVITAGILMLLAGVASAGLDMPGAALRLLGPGGIVTADTLLERVIYKPLLRERPGVGWVKTAERFVDHDSGKTVDVFYNPSSGERRYVAQEPEKQN